MPGKHIVNRFEFETIIAGVFRMISDGHMLSKYYKYLESDWFYRNDQTEEVVALRKIIDLIHSVIKEGHINQISLVYIEQQIPQKYISDEEAKKIGGFYTAWYSNEKITRRINDKGCFSDFLKYLKTLQIAKIAKPFSDSYQSGDIETAVTTMQTIISEIGSIGKDASETIDFRELSTLLKVDPSMLDFNSLFLGNEALDDQIGGYPQQTLNLFIAPTNGGKTAFCHHLIRQCVESKKHAHVLCVEDRRDSFMYKVTAAITGIPAKRLKEKYGKLTSSEQALVDQASKDLYEYIHVDFVYGCDVGGLHKLSRDYDIQCEIAGRPIPTVNIVDYTAHIAERSFGEKMHNKLRNAYAARKDFCLEYNKIGFDFAQVNREGSRGVEDDKMLTENDIAGGYDLAQVCDNIMSINRHSSDHDNFKARLHVCKSRDGLKGFTISVGTQFHCSRYDMKNYDWLHGPQELINEYNRRRKESEKN